MSQTETLTGSTGANQSHGLMRLFQMDFQHDYYNLNDDRCEDFAVVPSPDTAAFIQSVGLKINDRGAGIDIYLPANRKDAFLRAIDGNAGASLRFLLLLKNPTFIGVTALPIDTNPTRQAIYASNLQVKKQGLQYNFGTTGTIQPSSLVAVTGSEIPVNNSAAGTVVNRNIWGDNVVSVDTGSNDASLSLAGQPFGLYAISATPASAYQGPDKLLYLPAAASPIAFVELALKQPADGEGPREAFPVSAYDQAILPVELVMQFAARSTFWNYYIVAQQQGRILESDLDISGTGTSFTKSLAHLPNGDNAILFSATQPAPMRQKAASRYSLSGSFVDPNGRAQAISVARLPTAPTTPVWPAIGDNMAGTSEIFVYL
tara:strand:+ start:1865 stop:2986 length:1122 start_codon:yes stop_codon:yes gene_type:complete